MKKNIFIALLFSITTLPMIATAQEKQTNKWEFIPKVVADVNGTEITKDDLLSYMKQTGNPRDFYMRSGKSLKIYTQEMLERMVNQIILAQLAAADGFQPGFKLIKTQIENELKNMSEEERKKFMNDLAENKMNLDDFCRKRADDAVDARQTAIDTWFDTKIKKEVKVSEKDLKDFYNKAADLITASQILIKPDGNSPEAKAEARKKAELILQRIKKGEDFTKIAAEESGCNSAVDGTPGSLGEFGRGQMVQEFEDAAFALPVDGISNVVETPFGFHIIKVFKKRKRELPPFNQVKDKIKEEVTLIKAQDIVLAKLKKAKENWKIDIKKFK